MDVKLSHTTNKKVKELRLLTLRLNVGDKSAAAYLGGAGTSSLQPQSEPHPLYSLQFRLHPLGLASTPRRRTNQLVGQLFSSLARSFPVSYPFSGRISDSRNYESQQFVFGKDLGFFSTACSVV
ncbi:hypothetical protein CRV24_002871 [Beauveria bassiana]|nr:hypothetical protein CRV24_002871 [Beauveria bassiana]